LQFVELIFYAGKTFAVPKYLKRRNFGGFDGFTKNPPKISSR